MLYVHGTNILAKIYARPNGYKGKKAEFTDFYNNKYCSMKNSIEALIFDNKHPDSFKKATNIFNNYYQDIQAFANKYKVTSQSKFVSTFLEEISEYLFKDLPFIKTKQYEVFNKSIYAGLKIENDSIALITKDVDFCIGKKSLIKIDNNPPINIIVPIVCVEVKTYLDATMFGEAKSSSKTLRSASPHSRAYILMGYKCIKDDHILASKQDSTFNEIFVLQKGEGLPFESDVIYDYWKEISQAVANASNPIQIPLYGRQLN